MCQCGRKESEACPGTCSQTGTVEKQQPEEIAVPAEAIKPIRFAGVTAIGATTCQCEACRGKSWKPTTPACQCDACRR